MKKLLLIIATVSALATIAGAPAEARSMRPHHGVGIGVGGRGAAIAAAATAAAIAAEAYGYGYAPYGYYGGPVAYGPGYYAHLAKLEPRLAASGPIPTFAFLSAATLRMLESNYH